MQRLGRHAACFLRAYAGAPVTRTLRPSLLRCGERPCDTLRALPENTAHQPKLPAAKQHAKPRQPSPAPHAKHQPPSNTLNRDSPPPPHTQNTSHHATDQTGDSLPPPQFARHGAHTLNHRESTATPAGPQCTPNTDTRRGAYILCRDIRVSELCEDGSPAGAKRIICTSHNKTVFIQGTQKSRRFRRISGIFFDVRPLGLEPRTH